MFNHGLGLGGGCVGGVGGGGGGVDSQHSYHMLMKPVRFATRVAGAVRTATTAATGGATDRAVASASKTGRRR